jgi:hypothetical protein
MVKTVILAWTHKVSNMSSSNLGNYWGLGDTIRGTIQMYQLSKQMGFRLIVDNQLHNVSQYLKPRQHEYIDFVLENKDNIPFIQNGEEYIKNATDDVLMFLTNGALVHREPITQDCKEFIRDILSPNDEFCEYLNRRTCEIPYENYTILHYRLNDGEIINNNENKIDYVKYLEHVKSNSEPNAILVSISKPLKEFIKSQLDIFMFDTEAGHFGYSGHKDIIRDTLFEFFVLTKAKLIKTHSVYRWTSGFARIANEIFDVPLQRI